MYLMEGEPIMNYQNFNAKTIDSWCDSGWEWGKSITHEEYENAKKGKWNVLLTPTKYVPHEWFGELRGKNLLGLASGGGQQIPIFSALGACCTVLDYSTAQCDSERLLADKEGYEVNVVQADMSKALPFDDETFDIIFHPVSNCYVEEVKPIFKECYRILKKGGILLCGLANGFGYIFDETECNIKYKLPFNPLKDPVAYEDSIKNDWGITFSHTIEEQIGGQLEAGFVLTNLYEDPSGSGMLHEYNVPTYIATRSIK